MAISSSILDQSATQIFFFNLYLPIISLLVHHIKALLHIEQPMSNEADFRSFSVSFVQLEFQLAVGASAVGVGTFRVARRQLDDDTLVDVVRRASTLHFILAAADVEPLNGGGGGDDEEEEARNEVVGGRGGEKGGGGE